MLEKLLGKPTVDQFAKAMMATLKEKGIAEDIRYLADVGEVRMLKQGEAKETVIHLDKLFRDYIQAQRPERKAMVERIARGLSETSEDEDFDSIKTTIYPRLRSRSYIELNKLRLPDFNPTFQEVTEHLVFTICIDREQSILEIMQPVEQHWDTSEHVAFANAMDNLRRDRQDAFEDIAPGVYRSAWQDNHDASRIALPELFYRLPLKGHPVVTVPNRDTLLVSGSEDTEGLVHLGEFTLKAVDHHRRVDGSALCLTDTTWHDYLPDRDHPAFATFVAARRMSMGLDYNEQQEILDGIHQDCGEGAFVASFSLLDNDEGEHSFCVWTQGVDTWLPITDLVALNTDDENEDIQFVSWHTVQQTMGDAMRPLEMYPARYAVNTFPSQTQMTQMHEIESELVR